MAVCCHLMFQSTEPDRLVKLAIDKPRTASSKKIQSSLSLAGFFKILIPLKIPEIVR